MTATTMALATADEPEEDPAAMYARLERNAARKGYTLGNAFLVSPILRNAARKGYTLNRTILGFMLKRGTVSKHFGRLETGFHLLREHTCSD